VEEGNVRDDIPGSRLGVRKLGEIDGLGRAIEPWVRTCASGTGVRAGHRSSGDLGLWVRNKEQWAHRGSEPLTPTCLCERTPCQDPNLRGSKGGSGWKRPVS
jgi:hypothetical protein